MKRSCRLAVQIFVFVLYTFPVSAERFVFRIGSYNVENLWDLDSENTPGVWRNFLASLPTKERAEIGYHRLQYWDYALSHSNWYNPDIFTKKIENFIEVLKLSGQPEIFALQEIESAGNLSQVFDTVLIDGETFRSKLEALGYHTILLGKQDHENPVAVTTAIISKLQLKPLESVRINLPGNSSSARDIQVVELMLGDSRTLIFNNHWKSRRGRWSEASRLLFADALSLRLEEEKKRDPHVRFVILGDFNTYYSESPLLTLGSTDDEMAMLGTKHNSSLYNLWFELEPESRWEHSYAGERSALSHILISDSLYENIGVGYIQNSFRVVGHEGLAKEKLLGANGRPFRWQIRKARRRAKHLGLGYSDHLPIIASFQYNDRSTRRRKVRLLSSTKQRATSALTSILLDEVKPCYEETAIPLSLSEPFAASQLLGRCVKLERPAHEDPFPLQTLGRDKLSGLRVQLKDETTGEKRSSEIVITMSRSDDWRPNIDDSRVSPLEAKIRPGFFSYSHWHPRSNMCFTRKVLRGPGGKLRRAMGRLGYDRGFLSLFVASREAHSIVLEDLPPAKRRACPWFQYTNNIL